jgi:hypothetical protein
MWSKEEVGQGIHPVRNEVLKIIFKNSVCTSKKTSNFTITDINWLILFKKTIYAYSENYMQPIKNAALLIVKMIAGLHRLTNRL